MENTVELDEIKIKKRELTRRLQNNMMRTTTLEGNYAWRGDLRKPHD